jgi:hypothetical protein
MTWHIIFINLNYIKISLYDTRLGTSNLVKGDHLPTELNTAHGWQDVNNLKKIRIDHYFDFHILQVFDMTKW